jgi:predicted ArsR family transcriptional regulator
MKEPDLFDICANRHGGTETSVAANLRVEKSTDRALVLSLLRLSPAGKTLDEVSAVLGRPPNQLSGRFTELVAAGQISKTDERRNTRTGASAAVYQFKRK